MRVRAYSIALAGLSSLLDASLAHGECKPAAVPQGDAALVSTLSERLAANGIDTQPDPSCPVVRVHVMQRGPQVHLRVTDAYERLGEREVQDVATAAAIIESWTLQEIDAGSMPPDAISMAAIARAPSTFGVGAAFRSAMTEQSSTWLGGSISGCMRVGKTCLGATIGFAKDIEATGAPSTDAHRLMQLDTRATAELAWSVGRFVVSPGVSLGYGWQRITSDHLDASMRPFTVTESSHGLRAGAQLRVAKPISPRLALFAELTADRTVARSGPTLGPQSWLGLALGARFGLP